MEGFRRVPVDARTMLGALGLALCLALGLSLGPMFGLEPPPALGLAPGPIVPHDLVAQEGGTSEAMLLDGNRLWLGVGPRLVALDVTNLADPQRVGRSAVLDGSVRHLASGSLEPNAAGGRPDLAWAIVAGNRLVGLDLRDPALPVVVGAVDMPADAAGIALVDDHVWVVTLGGALVGFDVGDPSAPMPGAGLDAVAPAYGVVGVAAVDGHVLIGAGGYGATPASILSVVDVRDPGRPAVVGQLEKPYPVEEWHAYDLAVADGVAWIAGGYEPYVLLAIDVGTPSTPTIIGRVEGEHEIFPDPRHLTVGRGRAYLSGGDGGHNVFVATVVDVRDPRTPRALGPVDLPRTSDPSGGMVSAGEHLLYGTRDGRLLVLDLHDTAARPPVAELQGIGASWTLEVDGERALIGLYEALLTVDGVPWSMRPRAEALLHYYPEQIHLAGDRAYVVTGGQMDVFGGELHVLDIADSDQPRVISKLLADIDPRRIAVDGAVGAVVAARLGTQGSLRGIAMLDLARPDAPALAGELHDASGFQDVALAGDRLYAVTPDRYASEPEPITLVLADVSDPGHPASTSRITLTAPVPNWPMARLAVDDSTVYVAAHGLTRDRRTVVDSALHVIDARNPDQPVRLARLPLDFAPRAIAVAHGYAFLPGNGGVRVVDVHDPAHPTARGLLPTGGDTAADVTCVDGLVYVPAGYGGLYVFRPRLDGWPEPPARTPTTPATAPTPTAATPTTAATTLTPPATVPSPIGTDLTPKPTSATATPGPTDGTGTPMATTGPTWAATIALPWASGG